MCWEPSRDGLEFLAAVQAGQCYLRGVLVRMPELFRARRRSQPRFLENKIACFTRGPRLCPRRHLRALLLDLSHMFLFRLACSAAEQHAHIMYGAELPLQLLVCLPQKHSVVSGCQYPIDPGLKTSAHILG